MLWVYRSVMPGRISAVLAIAIMACACGPALNSVYLMPSSHPLVKAGNDSLEYRDEVLSLRLSAVKGAEKQDIGRILGYGDIQSFMTDFHIIKLSATRLGDNEVSINFDNIMLVLNPYNRKQPLNYFDLYLIAEKDNNHELRAFIREYVKKGRTGITKETPVEAYLIFGKISPQEQHALLTFYDIYHSASSFKVEIPFSINLSRDPEIKEKLGF